jgi:hypothetical protein
MNRTEKALARFLRASSYREKLIQRGVIQRGESLLTGGRPLAGVYQEATESPSAPLSDDALR